MTMRFDLLDEYSTLVPFGLGISKQNRVVQYPAVAVRAANSGAGDNSASRPKLLRKLLGALRQTALLAYRNLVAKYFGKPHFG
jgi:hypothetical protein